MDLTPALTASSGDELVGVAQALRDVIDRRTVRPNVLDPLVTAKRLLRARRERVALFDPDVSSLFGEPAYDMLLDLYVALQEGVPVSVSGACIASGAPPTTALRCLENLIVAGAVAKSRDPHDNRRRFVVLTERAEQAVERHLLAFDD